MAQNQFHSLYSRFTCITFVIQEPNYWGILDTSVIGTIILRGTELSYQIKEVRVNKAGKTQIRQPWDASRILWISSSGFNSEKSFRGISDYNSKGTRDPVLIEEYIYQQ